jgi:hypothetical protein
MLVAAARHQSGGGRRFHAIACGADRIRGELAPLRWRRANVAKSGSAEEEIEASAQPIVRPSPLLARSPLRSRRGHPAQRRRHRRARRPSCSTPIEPWSQSTVGGSQTQADRGDRRRSGQGRQNRTAGEQIAGKLTRESRSRLPSRRTHRKGPAHRGIVDGAVTPLGNCGRGSHHVSEKRAADGNPPISARRHESPGR